MRKDAGQIEPACARARRLGFAAAFAALLIVAIPASRSEAAIPPVLGEGTRPWVAWFAFGPSIGMRHANTLFMLEQAVGMHFFGDSSGPALGFALQEGFGRWSQFLFQLGPRFWWDIPIVAGLGLYLSPFIQLGYSLTTWDCNHPSCTDHAFNLQFGFEPRLVIGDRGMVFWRIIGVDMRIGGEVAVTWNMLFGGGVTF